MHPSDLGTITSFDGYMWDLKDYFHWIGDTYTHALQLDLDSSIRPLLPAMPYLSAWFIAIAATALIVGMQDELAFALVTVLLKIMLHISLSRNAPLAFNLTNPITDAIMLLLLVWGIRSRRHSKHAPVAAHSTAEVELAQLQATIDQLITQNQSITDSSQRLQLDLETAKEYNTLLEASLGVDKPVGIFRTVLNATEEMRAMEPQTMKRNRQDDMLSVKHELDSANFELHLAVTHTKTLERQLAHEEANVKNLIEENELHKEEIRHLRREVESLASQVVTPSADLIGVTAKLDRAHNLIDTLKEDRNGLQDKLEDCVTLEEIHKAEIAFLRERVDSLASKHAQVSADVKERERRLLAFEVSQLDLQGGLVDTRTRNMVLQNDNDNLNRSLLKLLSDKTHFEHTSKRTSLAATHHAKLSRARVVLFPRKGGKPQPASVYPILRTVSLPGRTSPANSKAAPPLAKERNEGVVCDRKQGFLSSWS